MTCAKMVAGCQTDIQKYKMQILPFRRQESAVFTSTDLPMLSAHRILKCLAASAHEEKIELKTRLVPSRWKTQMQDGSKTERKVDDIG